MANSVITESIGTSTPSPTRASDVNKPPDRPSLQADGWGGGLTERVGGGVMTTVGDGGARPCRISQRTGAVPQRPGVIPLNIIPPFSPTADLLHASSSFLLPDIPLFSLSPRPFFFFRSLNFQNIPSAPCLSFFKPPTSSYLCFSSFLSSFSQFFLPPSLPLKPPNRT